MHTSGNWVIIGSDNGLSPVRRQAITWTNAAYCQFDPSIKLMKFVSKYKPFYDENAFEDIFC